MVVAEKVVGRRCRGFDNQKGINETSQRNFPQLPVELSKDDVLQSKETSSAGLAVSG